MSENKNEDRNEDKNSPVSGQQESSANDFEFLQERIKERPINKKKLLKRTIVTASMAVLFGVLACLSFLLLEPVFSNWLYPEEEPELVTFPQEQDEMLPEDMLTEGTTTGQETETGSEAEESAQTQTTDTAQDTGPSGDAETGTQETSLDADSSEENASGEDLLSEGSTEGNGTDGNPTDVFSEETETEEPLKPYQTQYEELYKVYKEVSSSMVTVTAVRSDVDWFNNTYQSEGTTAGVVIANNNRELLILSRKTPLDEAETIRITFCNGAYADAVIKKYDKNTDLAVIAADLKGIGDATLDYVTVAEVGSSAYSGVAGAPVIAVGNLFGYKDNVCYGMITSKGNNIYMADNGYKLITTDIYASENPSGILVNMDKEIIGIIDNSYNNEDTKNLLSAIGITELKGIITKLSNGEPIPYLGLYTQDVSSQIRSELGLPQGAYIFDIDMDSPAMLNGIQKGDILIQLDTQEIGSAAEYMNALRNASVEQSIKIVVYRANQDQYEQMEFMVQPQPLE